MKKIVLTTLGLVIALSIGFSSKDDTKLALAKEEAPQIIQYSHADHF